MKHIVKGIILCVIVIFISIFVAVKIYENVHIDSDYVAALCNGKDETTTCTYIFQKNDKFTYVVNENTGEGENKTVKNLKKGEVATPKEVLKVAKNSGTYSVIVLNRDYTISEVNVNGEYQDVKYNKGSLISEQMLLDFLDSL